MEERDRLKVDATVAPVEKDNSYILIYNVNIPQGQLRDADTATLVCDALERDFGGTEVFYEITGTYTLVNRRTGEERFWAGSFYPAGQITNEDGTFLPYSRGRLTDDLLHIDRRITQWTEFGGRDTDWVMDRLQSAIVTCNSRVYPSHPFLRRHELISRYSSKYHQRRVTRFDLR